MLPTSYIMLAIMWLVKKAALLLINIVLGLVLIYGVGAGAAFFGQRALLYFPAQSLGTPASYGASGFREVQLDTADGLRLKSWYAPAGKGRATVVLYHGNGGNIANRLHWGARFQRTGYGVLLVEYRGYGGNPGKPTEDGLFADGRAALAFLKAEGVTPERMVIAGESLGTGVAVRMAAEQRAAGVILESPFSSAVDVGQAAYFFLPVRLLMLDRFESLDYIAKIEAPLLVLHGDRDQVVPLKFGKRLFEAAIEPKEMHVLKGAAHGNLDQFGSFNLERAFVDRVTTQKP